MKVVWREVARRELRAILRYIAERNVSAADDINERIQLCAQRIGGHPFSHRHGRVPGTREAVVHPNYVVVYRVGTDEIEILSVMHSRRQYPPSE